MKAEFDIWKYRVGEHRLFLAGEEIPDGWFDSPKAAEEANKPSAPKRGRPKKAE